MLNQRLAGTWAAQWTWPFQPEDPLEFYSSSGDSKDIAHHTPGRNIWIRATKAISGGGGVVTSPPPVNVPVDPEPPNEPPADPEEPINPLPPDNSGGGQMTQLVPTGITALMRYIVPAWRGVLSGTSRTFPQLPVIGGTVKKLLAAVLGFLGLSEVLDLAQAVGASEEDAAVVSAFLECIEKMEEGGMIHRYTPSRRFAMQGMTDPGPKFFVMNLEQVQGYYTNFIMSRSGLQAHDDDQDTHRRPKRAPRRNASPGRRRS